MTAQPLEDVSAITFLGERLAEERPDRQDLERRIACGHSARFSMPQKTETYRIAASLRRESFYPIVQGYKDTAAVGMRFNVSDPVQLNQLHATASWSPSGVPSVEQLHANAEYSATTGVAVSNGTRRTSTDLFGPTKTSRKGYVVGIGHHNALIFDEPRRLDLDVSVDAAGNLDRLPDYQNVAVDIARLYTLDARLDVRGRPEFARERRRRDWAAMVVRGRCELLGRRAGVEVLRNVRSRVGASCGPLVTLAAGCRGALATQPRRAACELLFWRVRQQLRRPRQREALPGVLQLPGRRAERGAGAQFRQGADRVEPAADSPAACGHAGVYATWLRPAVFVGGLVTNLDAPDARTETADVGGQLDIRLSALSALDLTLSIGGAAAFDDGRVRREAMISLKILR